VEFPTHIYPFFPNGGSFFLWTHDCNSCIEKAQAGIRAFPAGGFFFVDLWINKIQPRHPERLDVTESIEQNHSNPRELELSLRRR
jgi:hypothetical protein